MGRSLILRTLAIVSVFVVGCGTKGDGSDKVMAKIVSICDEHTFAIENGLPENEDYKYDEKIANVALYEMADLNLTQEARKQAGERNQGILMRAAQRNQEAKINRSIKQSKK